MLDVMITATLRPELLRRTLESFTEKLFKDWPRRAIVNVDPAGLDVDQMEVVEVAYQFFPEVVYRTPPTAGFGAAFKWCWGQVTADIAFHLEDDWRLNLPVDMGTVMGIYRRYPELGALRLSKWRPDRHKVGSCKAWNKWLEWNGDFYEVPEDMRMLLGCTGHPSFVRGSLVRAVAPLLEPGMNPERQFRYNPAVSAIIRQYEHGAIAGASDEETQDVRTIEDIGEGWKREHGFKKCDKDKGKAWFTEWEKKDE